MARRFGSKILPGVVLGINVLLFSTPPAQALCTKPTITVQLQEPTPDGLITMYIWYTDAGTVSVYWNGVTEHLPAWSHPSPIKYTINASCSIEPRPLAVFAEACRGTRDEVFADPFETMINLDTTPIIQLAPRGDTTSGGFQQIEVDYKFPYTVYGFQRAMTVELLPNDGRAEPSLIFALPWSGFELSREGRVLVPVRDLATGTALVRATACSAKTAVSLAPLAEQECEECRAGQPPSCKTCVGHPVRTSSGNMRYVESESLPPLAGATLSRTYDSVKNKVGLFGRGWRSMFDSVLRVATVPARDGAIYATVTTEDAVEYVFRSVGPDFVQVTPSDPSRSTKLVRAAAGFTHVDHDGQHERTFDSTGRLVRLKDVRRGSALEISYDTNGLPARATDSRGNAAWIITTDLSARRITSITVEGRPDIVWTWAYSGDRLTSVTSSLGLWRTYEYQSTWPTAAISVVRDGQGRVIEQHSYDNNNRATSSYGVGADDIQTVAYSLPELNGTTGLLNGGRIQRTVITKKSGATETHLLQSFGGVWRPIQITGGCSSCGADDSSFVYDDHGNVIRSQSATGYITENIFSPTGARLVGTVTALRPSTCDPATDANLCRMPPRDLAAATLVETAATQHVSYAYADTKWPDRATQVVLKSVVADGGSRVESFVYDALSGATIQQTVSGWTGLSPREASQTTTATLYDGIESAVFQPGGSFDQSWTSLAQPGSEVKIADGPRTDVADETGFVYYPVHDSVPSTLRGRLAAVRNAAGHITRYESYDVFGNVTRVVEPNGVATESTYDAMGRLLTTVIRGVAGCDTAADPLCATDLTATRTWGGAGPLASETQPRGGVTVYGYDSRSRVVTVSRGPAANDLRERIETAYDPASGKKSTEKALAFENGAWVVKRSESYTYDLNGQLQSVVHPDGSSVGYTYSGGRVASVRDERHATANTRYEYDPEGRIAAVKQTHSTAAGGEVVTRYSYDVAGNLRSVTDPNANITSYLYDDFGRMLRQTSPVTGVTDYTYDSAGNLLSTVNALGTTTTREYDVLGRVTRSVAARGGESEAVQWIYDTGAVGLGRLELMTDPSGATAYGYDRRGLLTLERKTVGGAEYVTRYGYDAEGNRTRIVYPSGMLVTFGFDYAGRPITASADGQPLVISAKYLPFGPQTELRLANGTVKTSSYDSQYRMLSNVLTGPAGTLASYGYGYDGAGNILRIDDQTNAGYNRTFGYDDLNRLTAANSGSSLWGAGSYAYDAMGNLTAKQIGSSTASFTYRGTTPMLASVTEGGQARTVAYDAAGNETTAGTVSSAYTPRNLLSSHGATQYVFDGRGIRTMTIHPPKVVAITLPVSLLGGTPATGEIALSAPAGAEGAVVKLASDHAAVVVPTSVLVPAGATTISFAISTNAVSVPVVATVTATFNGTVRGTTTVEPARLSSLEVVPVSVIGGESARGIVTLTGKAPAGGLTVLLTSDAAAVSIPQQVAIAEGATTGEFTAASVPVVAAVEAHLTATLGTDTKDAALTVEPPSLVAFTLDPLRLYGGTSSAGSVTSSGAAPAAGMTVLLSGDAAAASVLSSVVIAAGQRSAAFSVSTSPVETETTARITAAFGAAELARFLTILPPALTEFTVTPATIIGGDPLTANVSLNAPAAPGGSAVSVTASDASVEGATLVVPSGATTVSGALRTTPVAVPKDVLITASRQGVTRSSTVRVEPPPVTLASIALSPTAIVGSNPATGTVVLTENAPPGGLEVELLSADIAVARVPSVVLVPAGAIQATFAIETSVVQAATPVAITSSHGVVERTATLSVAPPAGNYVTSVTVTPAFVGGGRTASGTVTLAVPSADKGGTDVTLTSSDPAVLAVPATVRVKPKDLTVPFTVATTVVTAPREVIVRAMYGGVTTTARVIVAPENAVTLSTFTIAPPAIASGATATATVTLSGPAPFGGATVPIEPQRRNIVTVPATVLVPEGAVAASFPVAGDTVHGKKERVVDVAATYNGITMTATVTVRPPDGAMQAGPPAAIQCASAALVPCLTATATAPIATFASTDYARRYSFYTPELNLMAETEETSLPAPRIEYEYIWFAGQPLAQMNRTTGEVAYYFNDHLGTPLLQTDTTGAVVWRAEYEPYGAVQTFRTGADRYQPLRFPGQEADDSELAYNIFRWYRSSWGRYSQADFAGLDGGLNLYRFANSNPIYAADPMGLAVNVVCRRVNVGSGFLAALVGAWLQPLHCRLQLSCPCSDGQVEPRAPFNKTVGMELTGGGYRVNTDNFLAPRWGGRFQDYERGWFNVPVTPPRNSGGCEFERCILNEARARENTTPQSYMRPYQIAGPNSNSYVRNLVDTCGGSAEWPRNAYGADPNPYWGGNYRP